MGTRGAPCPPAARSRTRKSATTGNPVRSAMTAGWPNCQVARGGSCQTVWPCDAIAAMSERATPASAIAATAASDSCAPTSKSSRAYSSGDAARIAAARRLRNGASYACCTNASNSGVMAPWASSRNRTTAALIPSSEVPDIRPTSTSDSGRAVPGQTSRVMSPAAAGRARRRECGRRRWPADAEQRTCRSPVSASRSRA